MEPTTYLSERFGFDNGEKFTSPNEVREYFTMKNMREMIGSECDDMTQDELDESASLVINQGFHCAFVQYEFILSAGGNTSHQVHKRYDDYHNAKSDYDIYGYYDIDGPAIYSHDNPPHKELTKITLDADGEIEDTETMEIDYFDGEPTQ